MTNPKPTLTLTGTNGNALAILSKARAAARRAGWTREDIDAFCERAKSGNYDHLLQTVMREFDVD